jgi:hypothetical protein
MAPVSIRHGNTLIHVNDASMLEATLALISPFDQQSAAAPDTDNVVMMIRKSAADIQESISSSLDNHCASLKDAVYKLKKSKQVSAPLYKRLTQLNAADSLLRHVSSPWLRQLEKDVEACCENTSTSGTSCSTDAKLLSDTSAPMSSKYGVSGGELDSGIIPSGRHFSAIPAESSINTVDMHDISQRLDRLEVLFTCAPPVHLQPSVDAILNEVITRQCTDGSPLSLRTHTLAHLLATTKMRRPMHIWYTLHLQISRRSTVKLLRLRRFTSQLKIYSRSKMVSR